MPLIISIVLTLSTANPAPPKPIDVVRDEGSGDQGGGDENSPTREKMRLQQLVTKQRSVPASSGTATSAMGGAQRR